MGIMKRISTIFQAKTNAALNKAEDPRQTLDLSYEQQLDNLTKVKRAVADVATARKRVEIQAEQLKSQGDKLAEQAKAALAQNNEPLAREALSRRQAITVQLADLETQHATIVDRIIAGIERRAREGRWYSGRPPFGYTLNDGQLTPDPVAAPTVRRIYRLYIADRLGTIAIAHRLRAEHAPAPEPDRV